MLPKIGEALECGPVTGRMRDCCGEFDEGCAGRHPRRSRNSNPAPRPLVDPAGPHRVDPHRLHHLLDVGRLSEPVLLRRREHAPRPHQSRSTHPASAARAYPARRSAFTLNWFRLSPALLILIFPLGFRLTCYYYRRSYYRAFWWSPPACAVADAHGKYSGESRFPLVIQNIHRYFFYAGLVFNVLLTYRRRPGLSRAGIGWGVSVGTIVLVRERHAALALLPALSRLSPPVRRSSEELQGPPVSLPILEVPHAAQRQAHELRVGLAALRRLHRYLHSSRRLWRHHRLQDSSKDDA